METFGSTGTNWLFTRDLNELPDKARNNLLRHAGYHPANQEPVVALCTVDQWLSRGELFVLLTGQRLIVRHRELHQCHLADITNIKLAAKNIHVFTGKAEIVLFALGMRPERGLLERLNQEITQAWLAAKGKAVSNGNESLPQDLQETPASPVTPELTPQIDNAASSKDESNVSPSEIPSSAPFSASSQALTPSQLQEHREKMAARNAKVESFLKSLVWWGLLFFGWMILWAVTKGIPGMGIPLSLALLGISAAYLLSQTHRPKLGRFFSRSYPEQAKGRAVGVLLFSIAAIVFPAPPESPNDNHPSTNQTSRAPTVRQPSLSDRPRTPTLSMAPNTAPSEQQMQQQMQQMQQQMQQKTQTPPPKRTIPKRQVIAKTRSLLRRMRRLEQQGRGMESLRRAMKRRQMWAFKRCGEQMRKHQAAVKALVQEAKALEEAKAWGDWTGIMWTHIGAGLTVLGSCVSCSYDAASYCKQARSDYLRNASTTLRKYRRAK